MNGELKKLSIVAYSDPQFDNKVADGEFNTLLNPEKYTFKYKIESNNDQASGTSDLSPKFNKKLPEDLELEFVFDRSGVIQGFEATEDGIIDDIEKFKKVILDYNGDEHKPNYLIISWGSLLFKGSLMEMSIEFKLFKPNGAPIRAIAKAKFQGFVEDDLRVAMENNKSPDLTHLRTVMDGDTLPLMAHRVYGDSKYYLEVAKVNNLTSFRKLHVGDQLFFPPIEKTTTK
ncbi:LysM peptidoglycan-binding domain-containing protein [Echinicola sp. CAU 1574]|uniref:LysM peptidoglycan-binding domain-containing protein n=1 Tax=Echinicola arenosa TaxID=2774144 RepID=A0ABR9AL58_9BACT|nr:LysM peptidoglycan-binding domain-containing protein [Echinicola arenosa]MBD8489279.1 LysM peptidoglycan-binding domain-containing protein [Echinicola arenosa]